MSNLGSGAVPTSGSALTTGAGDLIFGAFMDDSGTTTITAGAGFTQRQFTANDTASEDMIQTSAGAVAATANFAASTDYLAQMVAFRAASVAVTKPAAPAGLKASAGSAQVTLSWSASSGATSYYLPLDQHRQRCSVRRPAPPSPNRLTSGVLLLSSDGRQQCRRKRQVGETSATPRLTVPGVPSAVARRRQRTSFSPGTPPAARRELSIYQSTSKGGEGATPIGPASPPPRSPMPTLPTAPLQPGGRRQHARSASRGVAKPAAFVLDAAYKFGEVGTTTAGASGNGNTGTIVAP